MAQHENFKRDNPVAYAAWEMAQVYDNNRNEEGKLTDVGFMHISHIFGNIPAEYRGDVFMQFLSELDGREITYDVSDFAHEGKLN